MKYKNLLILSILILSIFMISSVSASDNSFADNSNSAVESVDAIAVSTSEDSNVNTVSSDYDKKIYVNTTGSDSNSGSVDKPFATINKGISSVNASDNAVIYLGEGNFTGTNNTDLKIDLDHVKNNGSLTFIGKGPDRTIIDGNFTHSIFASMSSNSIVTLKNIGFINSNGAIMSSGYLTIDNCNFINNSKNNAIYWEVYGIKNFTLLNSKFINNSARYASAIYAYTSNGNIIFKNNLFLNNSLTSNDNGVAARITGNNVTLFNNTFINMTNSYNYGQDAAFSLQSKTWGNVINNTFINCHNNGTFYATTIYIEGTNYLSGNKFINSTGLKGNIYNNGLMNVLISFNNVSTTTTNFTLTANVTDINGNIISNLVDYGAKYIYFYVNNTNLGRATVTNSFASLSTNKLLNNGKNIITGNYSGAYKENVTPGVLTYDVDQSPIDIYVSNTGNNETGDGTKNNPFKTIDKAIEYGFTKGVNVVIHLDDGIYSGIGNVNLSFNKLGRLTILGNYKKSILDGTNNSVFFVNEVPNSVVSLTFNNITFKNFATDGYNKGAILISKAENVIIKNSIFTNCFSKSGYSVLYTPNLIMDNCLVENITSDGYGPFAAEKANITNSIFKNIVFGDGLRMYFESEYRYFSGAITINSWSNSVSLYSKNNKFINIRPREDSSVNGGGISITTGGSDKVKVEFAISINDEFINNTALLGGAILGNCNVSNGKFINNTATKYGPLYLKGNCVLENNVYQNNKQNGNLNDIYVGTDSKINDLTLTFESFDSNTYYHDIIAKLSNKDNAIISGSNVEFFVNGNLIGSNELLYGQTTIPYNFKENGNYKLSGNYSAAFQGLKVNNGTGIIDVVSKTVTDLYVSDSRGNDNNDGSINSPFKTIKQAVYYAYGNENVTIHILEGKYSGNENTNIVINTTGILTIVGNNAIVNGDKNNFLNIVKIDNLILKNLILDNVKLITISSKDSKVLLNNFTFKNSNSILNNGNLTVVNSTFDNCSNSGHDYSAITNRGNLTVESSRFINNKADYAACIESNLVFTVLLNKCYFDHNYGWYLNYGAFNITDSLFTNNRGFSVEGAFNVLNSNFTENHFDDNYYGEAATLSGSGNVTNCNFVNNSAYGGGAIGLSGNSNIISCKFINNTAGVGTGGTGGAINIGGGTTLISNCYFEKNKSLNGRTSTNGGGAIYNRGITTVMNSKFIDNYAQTNGGAIRNGRGYSSDTLTVIACEFNNNRAGGDGGAISSYTDPSQYQQVAKTYIYSSTFFNNSAEGLGGAFYLSRSVGNILEDSVFISNKATSGGAVFVASDLELTNCQFINNSANEGGALRLNGAYPVINSSFIGNNATNGGAIYLATKGSNITNSIFLNNTASALGSAIFGQATNDLTTDLNTNWWGNNTNPNNVSNLLYGCPEITNWYIAELNNDTIFVGTKYDLYVVFKLNNGENSPYILPTRILKVNSTVAELNDSTIEFEDNVAKFNAIPNNEGKITARVDNQVLTVNVVKKIPSIKLDFANTVYGNNVTITATVTNSEGSLINGTVVIYIDGKKYNLTLNNGVASTKIGILNVSDYPVKAEYLENNEYKSFTNETVLKITKADTNILSIKVKDIQYSEVEPIVVTTNPLYNGTGNIVFGWSKHYPVTYVNGVATLNLTDLAVGNYIVTATTTGNNNFNGHSYDASGVTFRVTMANTKLNVKTEDIVFGEIENVVVTSKPLLNGTITLSIDDKDPVIIKMVNGTLEYGFENLTVGKHSIKAVFLGDTNYKPAVSSKTFSVFSPSNVIKLSGDDVKMYYKNGTKLLINVVTYDGKPVDNITISAAIDGEIYNMSVVNGSASMDLNLNPGVYNVSVWYNGTKYNSAETNVTVTILSTIHGNDITKYFRNDTQYYAIFVDGNGNPLANTNVTFIIDGVSYNRITNENGTAKLNINLNPGKYVITVINTLNNQSYFNNITILPVISDGKDIILYYRNGTRYSVKVLDGQGNPAVNVTVSFNINGRFYNKTTDKDGFASLAINLNPGTYIITAQSPNGDRMSNNITVLPTILGEDVVKYFRNGTRYSVKVLDGQGNPYKNANVTFNINGVFYHKTTDDDGFANLSINLNPGNYIITAEASNGARLSNNITVLPTILGEDVVKYFRNGTQYHVNVLDGQGNPAAGQNVTFNINGVFYHKVTDENGIATLNINLNPGVYSITSSFNGLNVNNRVEVLPTILAHDLTKKFNEKATFDATVVDAHGKPIAGQNVTFNVNGVFYHKVSDADGVVKLNINLNPGKYIITTSYNNLNIANKITITN